MARGSRERERGEEERGGEWRELRKRERKKTCKRKKTRSGLREKERDETGDEKKIKAAELGPTILTSLQKLLFKVRSFSLPLPALLASPAPRASPPAGPGVRRRRRLPLRVGIATESALSLADAGAAERLGNRIEEKLCSSPSLLSLLSLFLSLDLDSFSLPSSPSLDLQFFPPALPPSLAPNQRQS